MKRLLVLIALILGCAQLASAQTYTTVTATVTSPNGIAYAYGSYGVTLVNTSGQQATLGGNPNFQQTFSGQALTVSGSLSIVLPSVTAMSPSSGLQWQFNICANPAQVAGVFPAVATPCFSYTSTGTTISGTTVSLTTQLAAVAASIPTGGITPNASSANIVDPTQAPYNVKADGVVGADGTTTNTSNVFSSAHVNCSSADLGKLVVVVNLTTQGYPFGTGLTTVGVGGVACSGNSWLIGIAGVAQNATVTVSGTAQWAIGTDNGAALQSAYTATFVTGLLPGKTLGLPCGVMLVSVSPFIAPTSYASFQQRPSIQSCNATDNSNFVLHPNITAAFASTGGTIFANGQGIPTAPGSLTYQGLGGNGFIQNVQITTLSGNLPGGAGHTFILISGFQKVETVSVTGIGLAAGAGQVLSYGTGEADFRRLNFQNVNTALSSGWVSVVMSGQGVNAITASVIALGMGAITCSGGSACNIIDTYITSTVGGIVAFGSGNIIVIVGGNITSTIGGGIGAIGDGGSANTFYVFGNTAINQTIASYGTIQLANVGSIMDISGSTVSCVTGYCVTGAGTLNDRSGNNFSSVLTQFTGKYVGVGGGSMATSTTTANTNFGTAIGTTNLIPSVLFTTPVNVYVSTRQITLGVGCAAGANTAQVTISYTAPGGTAETQTATVLTASANGTVDTGSTAAQILPFTAKIGTAVTYSVASTLNSTGCSTTPQYAADLRVQ